MAKKCLLVLVLAGTLAGGLFAQADFRLGAGVGGYFTSDFGGGIEYLSGGKTMSAQILYAVGGGLVFFDATYAELSLGFFVGGGASEGNNSTGDKISYMGLDISLLGKFPFDISDMLSVFPLLGVTYRAMLSAKDANGNERKNFDGNELAGDFSSLRVKLGGGVDFFITDNIHLRGEVLYGLRFASKYEIDYVKRIPAGMNPKTLLGHGVEVKIAAGYRF
jgi:hypothetical protein